MEKFMAWHVVWPEIFRNGAGKFWWFQGKKSIWGKGGVKLSKLSGTVIFDISCYLSLVDPLVSISHEVALPLAPKVSPSQLAVTICHLIDEWKLMRVQLQVWDDAEGELQVICASSCCSSALLVLVAQDVQHDIQQDFQQDIQQDNAHSLSLGDYGKLLDAYHAGALLQLHSGNLGMKQLILPTFCVWRARLKKERLEEAVTTTNFSERMNHLMQSDLNYVSSCVSTKVRLHSQSSTSWHTWNLWTWDSVVRFTSLYIFQADTPHNVWWQRFCPDPPASSQANSLWKEDDLWNLFFGYVFWTLFSIFSCLQNWDFASCRFSSKACKPHSMRWSHAHPTWNLASSKSGALATLASYWICKSFFLQQFQGPDSPASEDFLVSTFRRSLASTSLQGWVPGLQRGCTWLHYVLCWQHLDTICLHHPRLLLATTGNGGLHLGELPVSEIPEDEDLLNVATWEATCCWS